MPGKEAIGALFTTLFRVFEDLRFDYAFTSTGGCEVLHSGWRLGDQEVDGVDMMCFDANGLIEDYTAMVRPLSAVVALRDAVWSQIEAG